MDYSKLVHDIPATAQRKMRLTRYLDFIHLFEKRADHMKKDVLSAKKYLAQNGIIWVSWPKKSSKVETDIIEPVLETLLLKMDWLM